jgi:ABC-2 type transport system ATP-binding protein
MTTPLAIHHLSKKFGAMQVLHDVSLTLEEGEIFGLIGLNGIGKTTLIKTVIGLIRADAGEISIFGESWLNIAAKRYLTYLPEKFQPSKLLTGAECIKLALSYYGKPFNLARAEQEAEMLGLRPDALKEKVATYSKGMGQKIGLIATLLADTPLIILDEPMSGLDPKARILLKSRLRDAKQAGRTIFFSSHILADIEEICDRIAILHDGAFQYTGSTADFCDRYRDMTLERAFLEVIGYDNSHTASTATTSGT